MCGSCLIVLDFCGRVWKCEANYRKSRQRNKITHCRLGNYPHRKHTRCKPRSCILYTGRRHPRELLRSNRTRNHRSSFSLRLLVAVLLGLSYLPRSSICLAYSTPEIDCTLPHRPNYEAPQFGQETSEQQHTQQNSLAGREELIYSRLDTLVFLVSNHLLS